VKDPVAIPPVSRKRGRPLVSRNKKTLAALAAAAAADSVGAAPAATAATTPVEVAAAIIGAVVSVGAAPLASPLQVPVAQLVLPPTWCASPGARWRSSGSPTPRSTGSPPSWPIFRPGARCAYHSPSGSSTPWGEPPDAHHGGGGQWWPAAVPRRGLPRGHGEELPPRRLTKVRRGLQNEDGLIPHLHPPRRVALLLRPRLMPS
jgi:hypothetical protein